MSPGVGLLSGRRILVAEDDSFLMDDLVRDLERLGAELVGPVATVQDALARRGVPFVFATGYDTRTVPARYAGVLTCEKPIEPAKIAKALFG